MDLLWQALGICAIVCVVLYFLASHWAKTLRQHAWALRRLAERIELLELQSTTATKHDDSAPLPLLQVFTFSFVLTDNFWLQTLQLSPTAWQIIKKQSSFLGSVKLERWRSHVAATITEVLPASETAKWQTRSFDFYPDSQQSNDSLTLWEISLTQPNGSPQTPPSLALSLRANSIELKGRYLPKLRQENTAGISNPSSSENEFVFFRVPLDREHLVRFEQPDPAAIEAVDPEASNAINGKQPTSGWQTFYSEQDANLGIEWQLRLKDLAKKAEWDEWHVLDATSTVPTRRGVV